MFAMFNLSSAFRFLEKSIVTEFGPELYSKQWKHFLNNNRIKVIKVRKTPNGGILLQNSINHRYFCIKRRYPTLVWCKLPGTFCFFRPPIRFYCGQNLIQSSTLFSQVAKVMIIGNDTSCKEIHSSVVLIENCTAWVFKGAHEWRDVTSSLWSLKFWPKQKHLWFLIY